MLVLLAAASFAPTYTSPAAASPHQAVHPGAVHPGIIHPGAVHRGHATALQVARKPQRKVQVAQRGRTHRSPGRDLAPRPVALHRDIAPLENATWDSPSVAPVVIEAIRTAAQESHIDPHLLAAIAWRESRFDPDAVNRRSSARGLLQFTKMTWLRAVRDFGAGHDLGPFAAAIRKEPSGELRVSEKRTLTAILHLRSDPVLSARLAADLMRRQHAAMRDQLGHDATSADLYLLHVLGPTGSARFFTALTHRPTAPSLDVASPAVLRNAGLLAKDGGAMTVANTYAAVQTMLETQQLHSAPLLATTDA